MCAACFHEKGVCTSQYCCTVQTFFVFTMHSLLFSMKWFCCCMKSKTFYQACLVSVYNFKISKSFQWSAIQLWWDGAGKGRGWKTAATIYCWLQQQPVHSRTAQLSDDSRGPTCIADLDSGALVLTNARNRPALLQLNRPLGTAVGVVGGGGGGKKNKQTPEVWYRSCKNTVVS